MATLVKYELKKILKGRFGMGACAFVLAMLAGYCGIQAATQMAFDLDTGKYVRGAQAIEIIAARADAHGTLTPERVAYDLDAYEEGLAVVDEYGDLSAETLHAQQGRDAAEARLRVTSDSYYGNLNAFTMFKDEDGLYVNETDLSVAAERNLRDALSKGHADGSAYSDAEKALWEARLSEVEFPLRWGSAAGWQEFADGVSIMVLAIIAVCIALSGVFAGEYQTGAAAIALPTRNGKSRSVRAKVAASALFAIAFYTVCAAVCAAMTLGPFGTAGFDLPVQVDTIWSPYGLSVGRYALITLGLGYLVLLGCVAVTLLISSKARGPMPAAVIPMAVIFLGLILSAVLPPLDRITALFPWNVLEGSICEALTSYGIGAFAIDRLTLAPILYVAIVVVCVPLAMRAFRRHQVA